MSSRSHRATGALSAAALAAAVCALAPQPSAQQTQRPKPRNTRWELYNDPREFAKLSGAAQNLLVAIYGPHPRFDEKGNPLPPRIPDFPGRLNHVRRETMSDPQNVLGNVLVNNAAGDATAQDTQSETALVLGSSGRLIAGFNDSGSFLGTNQFTGWAYSADSGVSWTDPGLLPGGNDAGDPVLARNTTTGRAYFISLRFDGAGINLWRSDNDGVTWMNPVNAGPGSPGFLDKDWIAVDNFPGAGNGNVYMITRDFGAANGIYMWRSTDHGSTFTPNGGTLIASGAAGNVQGAYVVVGTNHEVYALWYDSSVFPAEIRTRKSTDLGVSFGPTTTVTQLVSDQVNGNLTLPAGFRSNSFPQAFVNPVSGNIYVVYNNPTATVGGDRGNILLRQSTDGGATWSAAIQVNDDATTRAQYFPAIAVKPDGTGMAVCWYDNRSDAGNVNLERWGATATISGSTITFGPNFRISPQFPPVFGVDPVVNFVYMGDYDQMAADNTNYYTTWGDNRDNSIAVPSRKNANVRFTSFTQEGPGAIIDLGDISVQGGNLNGRIEPNECNDLFVTLTNSGAQPATGVSATLTTLTPGVTILDAVQPYADLPGGASATNAQPYQISTSPGFVCGSQIQFILTVTSSAGSGPLGFSLATGGDEYVIAIGNGDLTAGGMDIGNHGDDLTTSIMLPFPVTFYSSVFNAVNVSSNGNVQFSSNSAQFGNNCLPDAALSDLMAVHFDDMRTDGAGGGIFRSTLGSAPNRTFVLQWRCTYFSVPGNATFELRLHEGTSSFEMVYGALSNTASSATIGCQRGTGPSNTMHACNQPGSVAQGTMLSYSLPGCPSGDGECVTVQCYTLDFETEDDFTTPLGNGQAIDTEFGNLVIISGAGANLGPATFDSTTGGPNDPAINGDMLIDHGNVLLLQSSTLPAQSVPGFFDVITDDNDGGDLIFEFTAPVDPQSLLLADINPAPNLGASVTLLDENGAARVYDIPPGWTGTYGDAGPFQLNLNSSLPQVGAAPGFHVATANETPGFLQTRVVGLVVHLTGYGAMDELSFCR